MPEWAESKTELCAAWWLFCARKFRAAGLASDAYGRENKFAAPLAESTGFERWWLFGPPAMKWLIGADLRNGMIRSFA